MRSSPVAVSHVEPLCHEVRLIDGEDKDGIDGDDSDVVLMMMMRRTRRKAIFQILSRSNAKESLALERKDTQRLC